MKNNYYKIMQITELYKISVQNFKFGNLSRDNIKFHFCDFTTFLMSHFIIFYQIVNKILDYFDPASTLAARLISSLWNSEICQRINGPKKSTLKHKTISNNVQPLKFSTHSELVLAKILQLCLRST